MNHSDGLQDSVYEVPKYDLVACPVLVAPVLLVSLLSLEAPTLLMSPTFLEAPILLVSPTSMMMLWKTLKLVGLM